MTTVQHSSQKKQRLSRNMADSSLPMVALMTKYVLIVNLVPLRKFAVSSVDTVRYRQSCNETQLATKQ